MELWDSVLDANQKHVEATKHVTYLEHKYLSIPHNAMGKMFLNIAGKQEHYSIFISVVNIFV